LKGPTLRTHVTDAVDILERSDLTQCFQTVCRILLSELLGVITQSRPTARQWYIRVALYRYCFCSQILTKARQHDLLCMHLLRSIPGVGQILALVILYEIHDIHRFPQVGSFIS
jgi:transposase